MTVTEHYAWATATGVTGELYITGGQISMDVGRWPHVEAEVQTPALAGLFALLDPRTAPRRVVLSCGEQVAGVARTFDLAVRAVRAGDGRLAVSLASDEALVEDAAPSADIRPWDALEGTYGYTAAGLARMVLAEIGATVPTPTPDPSLQPYWELQNRMTNPRFQTTTKGAAPDTGSSALQSVSHVAAGDVSRRALQWTCATGGGKVIVAGHDPAAGLVTALPVKAGDWVSVSVDVSAVAPGRGRYLSVVFHSPDGGYVEITGPTVTAPDTRWTTLKMVAQVGETSSADHVSVRVWGDPITAGADQRMFATNVTVVAWDDEVPAFHGATPFDANYTYEWDGIADDSTSTRYPVVERNPESLVWRAGVGGMSYLAPLLQTVGLRLVCDGDRVWSLRHNDHVGPGAISVVYGENMTGFDVGADLDGWADAATVLYRWTWFGEELQRVDSYEAVTPPRKRIYRELNMPYPGPGRAEQIVRRAMTAGGRSTASAVTGWETAAEDAATITTDETTLTGTVGAVTFNLDTDEMTITLREQETP